MTTVTSNDIARLLRERYPLPEWALVFECRNRTGYGGGRDHFADAAAWCCYPSKGLHRLAFEIKVARSDWARELQTPEKRAWLEKHFHETWVVAAHGVVKEEELPSGWGLIVATKDGAGLRVSRHAAHRDYPPTAGPELAAMRAMAQQLHQQRVKTFSLDGEMVTADQIQKIVEERCAIKRESLTCATVAAKKAQQEASDAERMLRAPVHHLLELCGIQSWGFTNKDYREVVVTGLDKHLERAVMARVEKHLEAIKRAQEALTSLQAGMAEKP